MDKNKLAHAVKLHTALRSVEDDINKIDSNMVRSNATICYAYSDDGDHEKQLQNGRRFNNHGIVLTAAVDALRKRKAEIEKEIEEL